ncbi:MAG: hypothetical protein ACD_42C00290G0003 [uncultured bacterium]|nr:MAG: hypothetical protein ACD_42C00290G0003 [uncultured bacterium]OGT32538.1 MAG: hypothetical protein A3C44_02190 [Gammaproteobacteria bacterium RIFCSPHIGHO2_02_FULL_39_13]OGT48346.1 MAG: hypothetical protein A3E53_05885 [Gammaproteobacteria bacterium RIFCSPHIGHO2_12_FULL_39_24]
MGPIISATALMIHFLFDAYIVILLLRLLMQKRGASWNNPLSQLMYKLTEKILLPVRKIIPEIKGFDLSILLIAFILQFVEVILLWLVQFGGMPGAVGVVVVAFGQISAKFVYIYIYSIFINVLMSWVPSLQANPVSQLVYLLVEPLLACIRRWIPLSFSGIDISPIFALLGLTLLNILLVTPLIDFGTQLILR